MSPGDRSDDDDATASHALPSLASDELLELLGGFQAVRLIGSGSSGRVFECIDTHSPPPDQGRRVAVKVLAAAFADDAFLDRLRRQTILLGGVHSHCVARVFGVGDHEGAPLLIEELLDGEDLQTRLRRDGKLATRVALRAVRDAARGLRAALEVGVVHGDVKPANLFLHDGRVKLDDFGLGADRARDAVDLAVDAAADLRALGRTLYTLLTAQPMHDDVVDDALLPGAAPPLRALLRQLLQSDPARPQRYDELITQIEDTIAGKTTTTKTPPTPPSSPPAPPRPDPIASPTSTPPRAAPPVEADPFGSSSTSSAGFVGAPTGVMGSLKQMSVTEIAQTLELGRKTARVELQPTGGAPGVFACRAGRVVFAHCGDLDGAEAFFALAVHSEGFFRIHYGTDTDDDNVSAPTQFLLLETMRRVDERASLDVATQQTPLPVSLPSSSPFDGPTLAITIPPPAAPPPPETPTQPVKAPAPEVSDRHWANLPQTTPEAADFGFDDSRTVPSGEALARAAQTDVVPRSAWFQARRTARGLLLRGRDELLKRAPATAPHVAVVEAAVRARPWLLAMPVLSIALCFVVVVVVAAWPGFSLPDALAAIDAGRAQEVLDDVDPPASPPELLARAHALAALGQETEALEAYRAAAAAPLVDERALDWLLGRLALPAPDRTLDLLQRWPDETVRARLTALTNSADWLTRHNAATALRERAELTDVDQERVAVVDLTTAPLCAQRRDALLVLKALGKSEAARAAIQQATQTRKTDNHCLGNELTAALDAISSRAHPKAKSP